MIELPNSAFWRAYQAKSFGILQWTQMEDLWGQLAASPRDWFINEFGQKPPVEVSGAATLQAFLKDASAFIHQQQKASYCGCIYVDDIANPTFIRIFDPKKMGSACGSSSARIYPKWSLSRLKPEEMPTPVEPVKKSIWFNRAHKSA